MTSSNQITKKLLELCEQDNLPLIQVTKSSFVGYIGGQNGKWQVVTEVDESIIKVNSILPVAISEAKWVYIHEFLRWANNRLSIGHFDLDVEPDEVRFKTSLDVADGALTLGMFRSLMYRNLHTTDRHLKGLLQILIADKTPAEAARALIESTEVTDDTEETDDIDEGERETLLEMLSDVNLEQPPNNREDSTEQGDKDLPE